MHIGCIGSRSRRHHDRCYFIAMLLTQEDNKFMQLLKVELCVCVCLWIFVEIKKKYRWTTTRSLTNIAKQMRAMLLPIIWINLEAKSYFEIWIERDFLGIFSIHFYPELMYLL